MGIISKVLESNSYEITKDSNSAIVKAQKRVFTRVDAAIFCAAISGRKREEWQRALETGRRSAVAVHRSPKFPPNYRRARFKRTLIGLAAVERGEISRGKRRSLLPLSLSLSPSPLSLIVGKREFKSIRGRGKGNWVHQDGNGGKRGSMNREKNNELAIGFMGERGGQFFSFLFCPEIPRAPC